MQEKASSALPKHKISWISILPHGVHLTPGEMTDPTLVQNLPEFSKDPIFQDLIFTYGLFEEKKKKNMKENLQNSKCCILRLTELQNKFHVTVK